MSAPGTLTFIGGIKTALVDDHHEAFYWWWKSKLRNATLFHVDGHDDLCEAHVDDPLKSARDYNQLNIANFICPAVNHQIVSDIYWLNPHSEEKRLLFYEKPKTFFSKRDVILNDRNYKYGWAYLDNEKIKGTKKAEGKVISLEKIFISPHLPLIVDIDLDAFCCHRNSTLGKSESYEGALGFEERIDQSVHVLAQLPRPDLITIASSQGDGDYRCYVPPFMVEEVGRRLARCLRKLYQ